MFGARSSTDRASDYGSEGLGFESLQARRSIKPQVSPLTCGFVVAGVATAHRRGRNRGALNRLRALSEPRPHSRAGSAHRTAGSGPGSSRRPAVRRRSVAGRWPAAPGHRTTSAREGRRAGCHRSRRRRSRHGREHDAGRSGGDRFSQQVHRLRRQQEAALQGGAAAVLTGEDRSG